ncbi:RNA polymerase sigma factor [Mangrovibacillus cuniculi]|uniref:Sigma-70 family RNA polymerase sigma factor n=1 Tax=Mangrovibacillus cuniculi TaxID=2593652 RepID=A0A7S8CDX9_9BACI|nr:sigma-70 family RNA polymerase sigma factor [Mangrovibacillus cuniculi]QPC48116.1 sigma-70 family RNA polymerase sigma factor [Mangrovibacillus cuniculi]
MNELRDEELYRKVLQKDQEALSTLYSRYEKLIYSFVFKMTGDRTITEEVIQEVFIKIWRKHAPYEESKGKFSSWLLTMTRNMALDLIRKRNKVETYAYDERDDQRQEENTPEDHIEWKEKRHVVQEAISELKPDQQKVVELFYFQGETQQHIADQTGIPLGTIKGRIRLALKHIRKSLEQKGGIQDE